MTYDASQNGWFFQSVGNQARVFQTSRTNGQSLEDFWFSEDVANSPEFQDLPPNTKQEIIDMITYLQDFRAFNESGVVADAVDRKTALTPFFSEG